MPTKGTAKPTIGMMIRLPVDLRRWLEEEAERAGLSMTAVIVGILRRAAVISALDEEEGR